MDDDALRLLVALKNINEALLEGLKTAVFVLETERDLSDERRESMIGKLKGLMEQGRRCLGVAVWPSLCYQKLFRQRCSMPSDFSRLPQFLPSGTCRRVISKVQGLEPAQWE